MFEAGLEELAVAADVDAARALRAGTMPDALLCGEVGGLPPKDFDYGNSPIEFSGLMLAGRRAVLATSNGTRALHAVADAPAVFIGCLLNRQSVARAALGEAVRSKNGVQVICAGNDYGATFSLDDAVTAGAIVRALKRDLAEQASLGEIAVTDAAISVERLFELFAADPASAFHAGMHGRALDRLGFRADLDYCATLDCSECVPRLSIAGDGLLMLRAQRQ